MADAAPAAQVQLEAMRVSDCSWHPCQVSLCSSGSLEVHFESLNLTDFILNVEELYARVRVRSIPLEGDDCQHIEEGEHILAASKSNFNSLFIDAVVQEVRLTRHSRRIICRCTFMIKWMHQDPDSENITVPSSLIKKLSRESIKIHPVVAAFLNSMKKTSLSDGAFTILDEPYGEYDVNGAIEKQIEEIGNLATGASRELLEDIIVRAQPDSCKGDIKENALSCSRLPFTTNVGNSVRRSNRNRSKTKTEAEDHEPAISSSLQESAYNIFTKEEKDVTLTENRSPLNPLAARAALASLVSKFPQKLDFSFYEEEKNVVLESNDTTSLTHIAVRNESVTLNGDVEPGDLKIRKQSTFSAEKGEETLIRKVVLALRNDKLWQCAKPNSSHKKNLLPHAMGSKKKEVFIDDGLVQKNKKLKISFADQTQKSNEGKDPQKENSTLNQKGLKSSKQQPSRSSPRLNLLPHTRSQARS